MNTGIILTLAYPETIVPLAKEWYSPLLKYVTIGSKKHVRAGHAALVLIDKTTGILEYYDFGRYTTSYPNGRVRGSETDFELSLPIRAEIENDTILNLDSILKFFATNPKLTHGDGDLYASVCDAIDYNKTKTYITKVQNIGFVRYAAFIKDASNCARFVTEALIAGVTNNSIRSQLKKSKRFTPSTIGNVIIANTGNQVYVVSEDGDISEFKSTVSKENRRLFLDRLRGFNPSKEGKLVPKHNNTKSQHAQWLEGIGSGAWFEIHDIGSDREFRYRRISPYGHIDCDGIYTIENTGIDLTQAYKFVHYSNCKFFHIVQNENTYRFEFKKLFKD